MSQPRAQDDLLQPTLADYRSPGSDGAPPWHLGSQFYVAFLGGPPAATAVAWLNSARLGVDAKRRSLILAIGIAGSVLTIAAAAYYSIGAGLEARRAIRIGGRAAALLLFGCFYALQKSADRLYQANARTSPVFASLWLPGTVIVVVSGLVSLLLGMAAIGLWSGAP